jgi:hypothetical protein
MTDLAETILTGILTGLAADALWESGKWAYKNRQTVVDKLKRTPNDIVINLQPLSLRAETLPIRVTVNDRLGISDSFTTVRKDLDLRWRVEAPTPSLARRLEDLVAWYLNVS